MQVVFGVDVLVPWLVLNFELGLRDTADEAVAFNLGDDVGGTGSFIGERVDDDTEEDVHKNNIDDHEEGEIECVSEVIELIRLESLPECITDTTTTSHSETGCGHQAVDKFSAVHVVGSSWRHRCVILIIIGTSVGVLFVVGTNISEGKEGIQVKQNQEENTNGTKTNGVIRDNQGDLPKCLDLVQDIK